MVHQVLNSLGMVIPTFAKEYFYLDLLYVGCLGKKIPKNSLPNGGAFDGNEPHGIPIR